MNVFRTKLNRVRNVVFLSVALWATLISVASAEIIRSFDSDITINDDSSLSITETILYDFGNEYRHGIYRNIKNTHAQSATHWYKERYIDFELLSVTRDGKSEPYVLQNYDGLSIKIGSANKTISGPHLYQIQYKVLGAVSSYEEGQTELYWNVTGDDWPTSLEMVNVSVQTSGQATMEDSQTCYVGVAGSQDYCKSIYADNLSKFSAGKIANGQQVTIAQSITLPYPPVVLEKFNWLFILPAIFIFLILIISLWIQRWVTHYDIDVPIIAQYVPYQNFKPMFTGVLIDNDLDMRDVTAGIIYLAQQGFITIKNLSKKTSTSLFYDNDFEITLKKSIDLAETEFQRTLLKLIFWGQEDARKIKRSFFSFSFPKPRITSLEKVLDHVDMTPGKVVKLSDIKTDRQKLQINYLLIKKLRKDVEKDLLERGFIEQRLSRDIINILLSFMVVGSALIYQFWNFSNLALFSIFIFITGSMFVFLITATERRTRRGFEALNHLKGFKDFLSMTEKERYAFHNAPNKNPEQFMEFLPHAIAFGVEDKWASVFKDVTTQNPSWYYDDVAHGSFNAVAFTQSLNSFSTVFTQSASSSGSSGGGSAGGGSGGGGGGSW